ncbi:hypothetical protein [Saccharothrix sp. Mg75]
MATTSNPPRIPIDWCTRCGHKKNNPRATCVCPSCACGTTR